MAILKKVLIVLVLLCAVLAVIGLLLPRRVHAERAAVIDAPRATVFVLLNGFASFNKWSPWFERDPQAKYTYDGPASGVGAKMSWVGDPKTTGSGSQEIFESRPFELVRTRLDFGSEGKAEAQFTLTPEGTGTRVTWAFETDLGMNPVSRYFGLMIDKMVGSDYEKGLAGLKKLAEGLPKADFSTLEVETVEVAPVTVAYVSTSSTTDEKAIASAYAQVGRFMAAQRLKQNAAPITINTRWSDAGYEFDAAIPVDRAPEREVPPASPVQIKQTYAGKALKAIHRGGYGSMPATYEKLAAYAAAHGHEGAGPTWDQYVTDPGNTPEAELVTHVYMPIR
jgi:effector-binding domain-containing protein